MGRCTKYFYVNKAFFHLLPFFTYYDYKFLINMADIQLGPDEFACGPIYALELAMNNHAKFIKTKFDVMVVWFHWCLLRNGFYFFGGELTHSDIHSETLPPNLCFNGDRAAYAMKYGKGVMPYIVGIYLKEDRIDISLVSLYRSLRLGLTVDDLVDDCLNLKDDTVQQMTMLADNELIEPMALDWNADQPDATVDDQPVAADTLVTFNKQAMSRTNPTTEPITSRG